MNVTTLEQQRIQEIVTEYHNNGYDVIVSPGKEHLPDFLAAYRLDALARKNGESVVIELRSRPELAQSDEMYQLAEVVKGHPGWTLELIVINPERPTNEELSRSLNEKDITHTIAEVDTLLKENFTEAALLRGWVVVEATLRLLAFSEDITLEKRGPNYLLERLTVEGVLSREDYQTLLDALRLRNEVAHGFRVEPEGISQVRVQNLLEVIQRLLNDQLENSSS